MSTTKELILLAILTASTVWKENGCLKETAFPFLHSHTLRNSQIKTGFYLIQAVLGRVAILKSGVPLTTRLSVVEDSLHAGSMCMNVINTYCCIHTVCPIIEIIIKIMSNKCTLSFTWYKHTNVNPK